MISDDQSRMEAWSWQKHVVYQQSEKPRLDSLSSAFSFPVCELFQVPQRTLNSTTCLCTSGFYLFCALHEQLLVSNLVGALSPVNHKGVHQDRTQTSIYLQVIHSTSHYTTSLFLSKRNFEMQNQKSNNTCFGGYLYSVNTQHGNLHPTG